MHTTTVYLICFQPGIPRGARPGNASHYLGSTSYPDPADRLHEHLTGAGSPLVKAAHDRGLNPEIVATWPGSKQDRAGDEAPPPPRALLPALQDVGGASDRASNRFPGSV